MVTKTNVELAREKLDRLINEVEGLCAGANCNIDNNIAWEAAAHDIVEQLRHGIFFIALNESAGSDRDIKLANGKKNFEIALAKKYEIEKSKKLAHEELERFNHIKMSLKIIEGCLKE